MLNANVINLVYSSSVSDMCEINSSFDSGRILVAYHGKNRNGTCISKEAFEESIPSIYNCPVVCNYMRETDSIGSHDIEIVQSENGMRIVHVTQPVGVIPESAKHGWVSITESDGQVHEYLWVDALIWKRQEAYKKLKENIITDESMEITVLNSRTVDGCVFIDSFEFNAFCLLESAEPCFESASLEMFALDSFNTEYTRMMNDFKNQFSDVNTSIEDDINTTNKSLTKGGSDSLEKTSVFESIDAVKDGCGSIDVKDSDNDKLNYAVGGVIERKEPQTTAADEDDSNGEDLVEKEHDSDPPSPVQSSPQDAVASTPQHEESEVESVAGDDAHVDSPVPAEDESHNDSDADGADEMHEDTEQTQDVESVFSLTSGQMRDQFYEVFRKETIVDPEYGEMQHYFFYDYDQSLSEVYFYDNCDWNLYGCKYHMDGDHIVVEFDAISRKKIVIVDFEEGSSEPDIKDLIDIYCESMTKQVAEKICALEEYRNQKESEIKQAGINALFEQFKDLDGMEAFEELKEHTDEMSLEEIENKCFELKGRKSFATFSVSSPKSTRLPVDVICHSDEPYGGLFSQFPPSGR